MIVGEGQGEVLAVMEFVTRWLHISNADTVFDRRKEARGDQVFLGSIDFLHSLGHLVVIS